MPERLQRPRSRDQRPPSRHMRSLLRQAFFAVYRVIRALNLAGALRSPEVVALHRAVALCRRATARDPQPDWLAALATAVPPGRTEAVAALDLLLQHLAAIELDWERRLVAAGIDPKWPASGA